MSLRDAGIEIEAFNPLNPLRQSVALFLAGTRDHRKLLVIDSRIEGDVTIAWSLARVMD